MRRSFTPNISVHPVGKKICVGSKNDGNFLGATRSIEPISYGNVSGWMGGWLSVTAGIV